MKKIIFTTVTALIITSMAWTAYASNGSIFGDSFDLSRFDMSYNTGNLNGQCGWTTYTGGGTVQVIEATASTYQKVSSRMKSVEVVDSSTNSYAYAYKDFKDTDMGLFTVSMRAEQTDGAFQVGLKDGNNLKAQVGFRQNGKISYYNGTTHTDTDLSYVANKWYRFTVEFDCSMDKYTLYVYDDTGDLKVYITDINFYGVGDKINRVVFGAGTSDVGTYQFDGITIYETGRVWFI